MGYGILTKKDLTREEALRLHYKMWTEMQEKLGDNPTPEERQDFKRNWCYNWARKNNYDRDVMSNCFLCECVSGNCDYCPIDWSQAEDIDRSYEDLGYVTDCTDFYIISDYNCASPYYKYAPISKILAIPERSEVT